MQLVDPVRTVAFVFGLLLVITRIPAVINPGKFKGFVTRMVRKNTKFLGALAALVGATALYTIWPEVDLLAILASFFGVVMVGFGVLCFAFRHRILALAHAMAKTSHPFIRSAPFFKVVVGLIILYLALP